MPDTTTCFTRRVIALAATLALTTPLCLLPSGNRNLLTTPAAAAPTASPAEIVLREGVGISGVGQGGRRPFSTDAVQAQIVSGTWQPPKAGDKVRLPDGSERAWETIKTNDKGEFEGRGAGGGGYLYVAVESPDERAALLDARGNNGVYVNGELRMGNPYQYGYSRLPVKLRRGTNHFLFIGGRGLSARLNPVQMGTQIVNPEDPTLPDLIVGQKQELWGAVIIVNASDAPTSASLRLQAQVLADPKTNGGVASPLQETPLPTIAPWSARKVGFRLTPPATLTSGDAHLAVSVQGSKDQAVAPKTEIPIRVVRPTDPYKATFISQIDGSVQYYGVNPAQKPSPGNALILSLHGASVEALGQAQAYGPKDWATLVAATNRRPYGFDWEDWGRLDALEVLGIAERTFPHDPARVSLTGHSMGGHGTWSVGSLFPDKFNALGPSAGWISFATYAGGPAPTLANPTATDTLLARGTSLSDTLARGQNYQMLPIYIVHGDADDNVPVEQAREMRKYLTEHHHPSVQVHEQPGAGHWWDESPAPGADCVDWAPMFELFKNSRIVTPATVDFTTPDPAVSAACYWLRIEQQDQPLSPSQARLTWDAATGTVRGTTANIARLTLLPGKLPQAATLAHLELDGQTLSPGKDKPFDLVKRNGRWQVTDKTVPAGEKNPERGGTFKQAFQNRFVLLYGTGGTPQENAWAQARARYDAESFWYRGNGAPDVLPDTAYDARKMADRSIIVYGHADMNRAWKSLLGSSPVQVRRGTVQVGNATRSGDNLACLFLRPRPGSNRALVGAITGTGLSGLRLTDRLPVWVSGVVYPDWVIADTGVLSDARKGVVGAGYFGNDWKLDPTQSAWRDAGTPEPARTATR